MVETKDSESQDLCFFGGHTFVPISRQNARCRRAVSHSSTKAEVISSDRITFANDEDPSRQLKPNTLKTRQASIDFVPPIVQEPGNHAHLLTFEDTEVVIKMVIFAGAPHMRHVSRSIVLTWIGFFERTILNSNTSVRYVHTNKSQTFHRKFLRTRQVE